jgi:hypothetical protein
MSQQRRHIEHTDSFAEGLSNEAVRCKAAAEGLPRGPARDTMPRRARQTETASHMSEWLTSPGLQSLK